MKNLWLFFFILFPAIASATIPVKNAFTGVPGLACQPSDSNSNCGGGGSGNVGIGKTNRIPVYIGSTTIGSPYNITADSNGNVGIGTSTVRGGLSVMNGNVGIGTWVPGGALVVQNGNVGIGVNSPASPLDISGNDNDISLRYNGTLQAQIFSQGAAGNDLILQSNVANLDFFGQGNEPLRIFSAVSGGIGNTAPFNFSVVSGTDSFLGYYADYSTGYRTRGTAAGILEFNNGLWTLTDDTGLTALNSYTPTVRLAVNSSGNVGIGTTTPAGGLAVMNGNVGIGTWVPKGTLDVGATGSICLGGTCDTTWPAGGSSGPGWFTDGNLGIGTYSNIGVGTISPSDTLYVQTVNNGGTFNYVPTGIGGNDVNTVLLLTLNNNVTDTGQYGLTITNSNATFSNSSPVFAGTYFGVFNGTSAVLTAADEPYLNFNGNAFTVDTQFKSASLPGVNGTQALASKYDSAANNGFELYLHNTAGTYKLEAEVDVSGSSSAATISGNITIGTGAWHHVAWQRSGNTFSLFYDGTSVASTTTATSIPVNTGNFAIGDLEFGSTDTNFWNGDISEFRVSNIARYSGNFTPPTAPYTLANPKPGLILQGSGSQYAKFWADGSVANNPIKINDASGTRMTINAGNVGIGTTTPMGALTIMNGNVGIGTWVPTSSVQIKGTCGAIGPVGTCWTSSGQLGFCSGAANVCSTCTAC